MDAGQLRWHLLCPIDGEQAMMRSNKERFSATCCFTTAIGAARLDR
jgi:hypothetical protein